MSRKDIDQNHTKKPAMGPGLIGPKGNERNNKAVSKKDTNGKNKEGQKVNEVFEIRKNKFWFKKKKN